MKAGVVPIVDLYRNTPIGIKSMSDDVIKSMNDELETTREKVRIRKEFATQLEFRLKHALDKMEKNRSELGKLGSSPKGIYLTSNAKLERSEIVERIKKTKKEIIAIAASFQSSEVGSHKSQDVVCSNEVQEVIECKDAGAVKGDLDKKMELLKNISIRSTEDYRGSGIVDEATNIIKHELLNIQEECLSTSELSGSLLKSMKEKLASSSDSSERAARVSESHV